MSTTSDSLAERDTLAALGRSWWLLLAAGALTVILGLACVVWTDKTVTLLAVLFGLYLLVSGILTLAQSFSNAANRGLLAISGILSIILAVYCFKAIHNDNQAELLALFIGLAWLLRGIIQFLVALQSKGADGRGWLMISALLLIVGAIVVFVYPSLALGALVSISGIVLIIVGLSEIATSFQVKKLAGA